MGNRVTGGRGGDPSLREKMPVEVGDIVVAHLKADLRYRHVRLRQNLAGVENAQLPYIIDKIITGILLKKREKLDSLIPAISAASDRLTASLKFSRI